MDNSGSFNNSINNNLNNSNIINYVPNPKKKTLTHKTKKKDIKEIEKLIEKKREIDKLEMDLEKINSEISSYKSEIKRLFTQSNSKETELKNYIAKLWLFSLIQGYHTNFQ